MRRLRVERILYGRGGGSIWAKIVSATETLIFGGGVVISENVNILLLY